MQPAFGRQDWKHAIVLPSCNVLHAMTYIVVFSRVCAGRLLRPRATEASTQKLKCESYSRAQSKRQLRNTKASRTVARSRSVNSEIQKRVVQSHAVEASTQKLKSESYSRAQSKRQLRNSKASRTAARSRSVNSETQKRVVQPRAVEASTQKLKSESNSRAQPKRQLRNSDDHQASTSDRKRRAQLSTRGEKQL